MNANARLGIQWMQISPWEYAMMWTSAWEYAMVWMSFCRYVMNANAHLGMQWMRIPAWVCNECKCLLESMPWCECLLESMSWRECPLVGMQWMRMPPCGYIMTRMLWCKHNLFKNFLYFQNEAFSTLETKIFSKLDLLFMKSHLLFYLTLPKKWWSLLEIFEWGIDLEFDDLAQKIYFHNWGEQKGWHVSKTFFWKSEFFKNQAS